MQKMAGIDFRQELGQMFDHFRFTLRRQGKQDQVELVGYAASVLIIEGGGNFEGAIEIFARRFGLTAAEPD